MNIIVIKTKQRCGLSKEGRQREKRCRRKNVKDVYRTISRLVTEVFFLGTRASSKAVIL